MQEIADNHIFLTSSDNITEICRPLEKHLGITSFVFQRNYDDGSEIRLSNQPVWLKHFYDMGYSKQSVFENHPSQFQEGYILWSQLNTHDNILQAAREHNIDHGITLIKPHNNYCEFYFLGTKRENYNIVNVYLNNIDLIERFILHFKDKAYRLINQAENSRIIVADKYTQPATSTDRLLDSINRKEFLAQTKFKKYLLNNQFQGIKLSKRELDCIRLLLRGKSNTEIAEKLFISPRTVETHINHLKEKLECRTRSELIGALIDQGLGALI